MKKCKCIKESSWFLIDDSFDKNSKLNGGGFSFQVGSEYDCFKKIHHLEMVCRLSTLNTEKKILLVLMK